MKIKKTKQNLADNPFFSPKADPNGSWTGTTDTMDLPVQDADDL